MAFKKKFPYKAALVACNGSCGATREKPKSTNGRLGCGACVSACKFGAIHLNDNGVADVEEEKCVACGACARACPQHIIRIHECANYIVVKCANHDKGAEARKECNVSCIGCGICQKTCTAGAIRVQENRAVIDETYCLSCGMCSVKCPRHAIYDLRGIITAKA